MQKLIWTTALKIITVFGLALLFIFIFSPSLTPIFANLYDFESNCMPAVDLDNSLGIILGSIIGSFLGAWIVNLYTKNKYYYALIGSLLGGIISFIYVFVCLDGKYISLFFLLPPALAFIADFIGAWRDIKKA